MRQAVVGLAAVFACGGLSISAFSADPPATAQSLALFTHDVRPILVDHCVKCHGGEKTKAGFDLTTRAGLLHPGDEGPNVVPGDSKASRLMKLIRHEIDPGMPSKADPLPGDAIAKIAAWIDAGAPYDKPLVEKSVVARGHSTVTDEDRKFWSFLPLASNITPPSVKNENWCRTPVDRFVLGKLEEKQLTPNGIADRRKLIRRAYLDLLGLPPKPEAVEAFVNDSDPQAWEKLIDQLLASPQYGERWARHWLDLARFAESHGYEHDYDRSNAYHYRDFVIKALNEDMPFNRFVRLQVAGDELEPNNPQALMATGFLAAGTHSTQITAATAEKERYDELDDMARTVSSTMLGLTVGCARCHDHKYDPIPTRDYYRLLSTFTTTVRSNLDIETQSPAYQKDKQEYDRKHQILVDALSTYTKEKLPAALDKWLVNGHPMRPVKWHVLDMIDATSIWKNKLVKQVDGSFLNTGIRHDRESYIFTAHTLLSGIRGLKVEALTDPSFPNAGPGRADDGNFALTGLILKAVPLHGRIKGRSILSQLRPITATFEQIGAPLADTVDEDYSTGWSIAPQTSKNHAAVWALDKPINYGPDGAVLTLTAIFYGNVGHSIGRIRISVCTDDGPIDLTGEQGYDMPVDVADILANDPTHCTAAQRERLLDFYGFIDPEARRLADAITQDALHAPRLPKLNILICSEGVPPLKLNTAVPDLPDFYKETYFLKRGDVNQKDGQATAGPLTILTRAPDAEKRWQVTPPPNSKLSYRRTALANWLTDVDAGAGNLLARVIVNRLWQHHMGRGIVATPNDFGAQGARPTHPELLDYLADQLIAGNWQLKTIHKLIMTSSVYMQSTAWDEQRASIDRENTLYWRRPLIRLEGEAIRDSMLSVSGQLDPTMYGPGTLDESMKRRSIYFFVKRSKLIPMMMLFDWPDALQSLGERSSTTVAPQALALMNHPQVQAYAKAFAQQLLPTAKKSIEDAIKQAYNQALGRSPDEVELADALEFLKSQSELESALTSFCQTLFALNEFIYVE